MYSYPDCCEMYKAEYKRVPSSEYGNYLKRWIMKLKVRPGSNVAPLLCRTKLDKFDFGATAGSDGVLVSKFIREDGSKNFRRENTAAF